MVGNYLVGHDDYHPEKDVENEVLEDDSVAQKLSHGRPQTLVDLLRPCDLLVFDSTALVVAASRNEIELDFFPLPLCVEEILLRQSATILLCDPAHDVLALREAVKAV